MNISILIPSRNGLEFLQWSYNSIRRNQGSHDVEILILDDFSDKDDTWKWLSEISKEDKNLRIFRNAGPDRYGISGGYKFLSLRATKEIIAHWHNDMFMVEGTLDVIEEEMYETEKVDMGYGEYWTNFIPLKKNVICLTRIEPPIYNKPGLYPEKIIWEDAPIEIEDWNEQNFLNYLAIAKKLWNDRMTGGHFAPFFMFRDEYMRLGGNDIDNFPLQAREDSDWAFRLVLDGFETIQIPTFVYHFASRGNRRSKYEAGTYIDNPKWKEIDIKSTRNFIRKWQTMNLHDEYLKPKKPIRYNIGFVVKNCSYNLLYNLEPWCDHIQCDIEREIVDRYVEFEQPNTKFDLRRRINSPLPKVPDIIVEIDGFKFNQDDMNYICYLCDILTDSGEENSEMGIGNLRLNIGKLNHHERNLIVCKNDIYSKGV